MHTHYVAISHATPDMWKMLNFLLFAGALVKTGNQKLFQVVENHVVGYFDHEPTVTELYALEQKKLDNLIRRSV